MAVDSGITLDMKSEEKREERPVAVVLEDVSDEPEDSNLLKYFLQCSLDMDPLDGVEEGAKDKILWNRVRFKYPRPMTGLHVSVLAAAVAVVDSQCGVPFHDPISGPLSSNRSEALE